MRTGCCLRRHSVKIDAKELIMARIFRSLALSLALAALAGGCVVSKTPLFGPETRALPFASGTRFQTYEQERSGRPWKKSEKPIVLIADAEKVIREADDAGKVKPDEDYTLHPLGPKRFLVQARFSAERYAYGVLEIRRGEGIVTALQCKNINRRAFKAAGGKITADDCALDGISNALRLLKQFAKHPTGPQIKYVPVRKL
jgi:hypothetical protein